MKAGLLRRIGVGAVIVLEVAVILAILWPTIRASLYQPAARRELLAFTSGLTVGMPRAEVMSRVGHAGRVHLMIADVDANLVIVDTPPTMGAGSWRAWLDFTNGTLSRIRIRTLDGEHIKPAGSPPDVGVAPRRE
jgi:hypothetical protein